MICAITYCNRRIGQHCTFSKSCDMYVPLNSSVGDVVARQCPKCGKWIYKYSTQWGFDCLYNFELCPICEICGEES